MKRPQLMGIVNITPDSFSNDGVMDTAAVLARFEGLVAEGAAVIDLGAESTRPGAVPLNADEEWSRLEPVLHAICAHPLRASIQLSVDSYHPKTIAQAIAWDVDIINDVSGLQSEIITRMLATSRQQIVVMHALSVPADPSMEWPTDIDPIQEIKCWRDNILQQAQAAGIDSARLIFDPGIGFGKSASHSVHLMLNIHQIIKPQENWLFGHSKKSYLKLFAGEASPSRWLETRDALTLSFSAILAQQGVAMLRVHDVAAHRQLFDRLGATHG